MKAKILFILLLICMVFTSMVTAPSHEMLPVYVVDAILAIAVIFTGGKVLKTLATLLLLFIIVLVLSDIKVGDDVNYREKAREKIDAHDNNVLGHKE